MRLIAFLASLILILMATLTGCGDSAEPTQVPPAELPQATALPPTPSPPPTTTPEPTPTPLSLSDLGSEFRTFVNETHDYAIQVPTDWEITPRGAGHADSIEVAVPGPSKTRGPNTVPPLVFSISALSPEAGYAGFDDVEANRSVGDEVLEKVDVEVNGLPARRIRSRDAVYGISLHYIIQRDDRFFVVDAYGYDQAAIEPILSTFGPPFDLTTETVNGEIRKRDLQARTMTMSTEGGFDRQVVWFTDTEILPRGRLEGHIDPGDHVRAEGIVADGGEIQATRITLQVPDHAGSDPVLEFQQIGGIAGFQDTLVIFEDGTVRLQRGSEEAVEQALSEDHWKKAKNYVSIFEPFAWHHEDNPDEPDNLVTDLDFYGTGKFEAVFDNQEEIVAYIQEILAALLE